MGNGLLIWMCPDTQEAKVAKITRSPFMLMSNVLDQTENQQTATRAR